MRSRQIPRGHPINTGLKFIPIQPLESIPVEQRASHFNKQVPNPWPDCFPVRNSMVPPFRASSVAGWLYKQTMPEAKTLKQLHGSMRRTPTCWVLNPKSARRCSFRRMEHQCFFPARHKRRSRCATFPPGSPTCAARTWKAGSCPATRLHNYRTHEAATARRFPEHV